MSLPHWLPGELLPTGTYDETLASGYGAFSTSFGGGVCAVDSLKIPPSSSLAGLPVLWDERREALDSKGTQYPHGYWHLISDQDKQMGGRRFNAARYKILPWCAAVIQNCCDPRVTVFDFRESNGSVRTYLWLQAVNYTVILERQWRGGGRAVAFLVTAFPLIYASKQRDMKQKYERRVT